MPARRGRRPVSTRPAVGRMNCRCRFASDALRHAISGPRPVRKSSSNPSGTLTRLKNGGPTEILVPRTASEMNREEGAPEHRERDPDQREVVEQERRLTTHQRLELHFRLQGRPAGVEQREREDRARQQEGEEVVADVGLGERVDRGDHPGAGDERAEDRQQERADDQRHVPPLQHAALFLDHHRVQEGGQDQPREQARRSRPGPTPRRRPTRARRRPTTCPRVIPTDRKIHDASAHFRIAMIQPASSVPGQHRGDAERERDRDADVAEVEHRRVHHHARILQLRIEAVAVRRRDCSIRSKGLL